MSDGPIHPVTQAMHAACVREEGCRVAEGLTKREYFAAAALQGLLTNPGFQWFTEEGARTLAHNCRVAADALLGALAEAPKT